MIEKLIPALEVLGIGMGTVFFVLAFFCFMIWAMKALDNKFSKHKSDQPLTMTNEFFESKPNAELVAVITAAVEQALNKKIRIKTIHFLDDQHETSWANSGRLDIMTSHNIK